MPFDSIYRLDDDQIQTIYKQLAKCFQDDDLFCAMYPNEKLRKKFLLYFFQHYIHFIARYCYIVGDSPACHSVMVVFDSSKETKTYIFRALWFNMKILRYGFHLHSIQGVRHMLALWDMFTSCWVNDFVTKAYFHMDLLYTIEEMRGCGLASTLIQTLFEEAKHAQRDVTMETHHKDNVELYEKLGFKRMGSVTQEHFHVTQYNLLYRANEVE